jgi:alpha-beta hydrolase superfamily lysophospholipase
MTDQQAAPRTSRVERVHGTDGWPVAVETMGQPDGPVVGGVLTVPAVKHERDAWGPILTAALTSRGFVVAATDIRGRGDSREPRAMGSLPPGQLRSVRGDVAAAIDHLASRPGVGTGSIVVMGEQDTANVAARAAFADERVAGLVLVTPRLGPHLLAQAERRPLPVCVIASKEDRAGLESAVGLFARSSDPRSRLRLVGDIGSGTTMFAAWQYLRRDEPPLEQWLAAWAASVV